MGTRGLFKINNEYYFRRFDSQPRNVFPEAKKLFAKQVSKQDFTRDMGLTKVSVKEIRETPIGFEPEYYYIVDYDKRKIYKTRYIDLPKVKKRGFFAGLMGKGWRREPVRHSLARKGVKTGRKK